jgi:hypothetical protein
MGLAAVFTGFSWKIPGDTSDTGWSNCCLYVGPGYGEELLPMQSYPEPSLDGRKDFLGVTIPASAVPTPTAISRSLSIRSSIIPTCRRSSASR